MNVKSQSQLRDKSQEWGKVPNAVDGIQEESSLEVTVKAWADFLFVAYARFYFLTPWCQCVWRLLDCLITSFKKDDYNSEVCCPLLLLFNNAFWAFECVGLLSGSL